MQRAHNIMKLTAYSIVGFWICILFYACTGKTKTEVAESARGFMAAYKEQDIAQMRIYYPDIDNIDIFYASDTAFIEEVIPLSDSGDYQVDIVSVYMTEDNGPEMQHVTLFMTNTGQKQPAYRITDSYGIASCKSYPHYKFAVQTGCLVPDSDLTDQQAIYRLRVAKDLLFYFSKLMYQDLEQNIRVTHTRILEQGKLNAHGSALVENSSDYTLPDLKYIIVYYDDNDRKVGEQSGWVTQAPFESGKTVSFEFFTTFDEAAATADFRLDFDLDLIMQFVMEDDVYTGREYDEFVSKKLIDI